MKKFNNKGLKPRVKLWLGSEDSRDSFGDGKWRLLETIGKTASLQSTCQLLGISYRKAWGDLKKAEQCLNLTLVATSRGGKTRGSSNLTPEGIAWMKAYSKFHQHVENAAETAYQKYLKNIDFKH